MPSDAICRPLGLTELYTGAGIKIVNE